MRQAERRKYHYIYKITRNDGSGKYYIGMHSTDNLDDGYFGSGKLLWKSINKHGKEIHSKEILEFLPSRAELRAREKELVNEEIVNDPLCMNLKLGGEGGWDDINNNKSNLYGRNGFAGNGGDNLIKGRTTEASISRWEKNYDLLVVSAKINIKKAQLSANTANAKKKRKETFIKNNHQCGDKNSQFGTCWVSDGKKPIKIPLIDLPCFLEKGFKKGRHKSKIL